MTELLLKLTFASHEFLLPLQSKHQLIPALGILLVLGWGPPKHRSPVALQGQDSAQGKISPKKLQQGWIPQLTERGATLPISPPSPSLHCSSGLFIFTGALISIYFCFILLCSREINLFCLLGPCSRLFI